MFQAILPKWQHHCRNWWTCDFNTVNEYIIWVFQLQQTNSIIFAKNTALFFRRRGDELGNLRLRDRHRNLIRPYPDAVQLVHGAQLFHKLVVFRQYPFLDERRGNPSAVALYGTVKETVFFAAETRQQAAVERQLRLVLSPAWCSGSPSQRQEQAVRHSPRLAVSLRSSLALSAGLSPGASSAALQALPAPSGRSVQAGR